ncbi:hypothetical protein acsn021_10100 [Anaerocolumna cellulosilytica]|uniref:DUF4340 domain-containing protein n=1 Tax=Anaerocolumna cellulosilytica TaxID=433286 RepID=A0A6S6R2P4_9FIRM|nr:DUF4340 domain-containing protein [Anaerocolumna cellulosilytica]MBB5194496.1 hypothetical protein [Anaerocolumna cellulosilytica]BCJ93441.1 hypothetical protein acsn021_10100 [Anaerocolumna cellulosilytica]
MAGGKKKSKNLLLLLIGMVLLIGVYLLLVQYNKKEQSEAEIADESTNSILTLEADRIDTIYFKNSSGEMTIKKGADGVWKYTEDETFPVRQTNAENMKNALTNITSSRTITEDTKELAAYGLNSPSIQITVTTKDGEATNISLGTEVPIAGGHYARLNDGNEVYIVTTAFYNYFNYNLTQMTEVETIPSITAENITHLAVESKDKQPFEVVYDSEKSSDLSGFTKWTMVKPYAAKIPADTDALTTLFGNYTGLSFLACVDYKGEDLSKYGLDKPYGMFSVNYYDEVTEEALEEPDKDVPSTDEKSEKNTQTDNTKAEQETKKVYYSYELCIGNQDEAGNYYAKSKDSNAVHTISADTVEKLLEIDAYSNSYHYINLINIEAVNQVTIHTGGNNYVLAIEKTKESKDGTESEVLKYYYNGKEAEETSFKELYQAIIAPVTDREIPSTDAGSNADDKTAVMSVTYQLTTRKEPLVIQYKPYDDSFYRVNSDGVEYFLTDARIINELAVKLKEFKPQTQK